LINSEQFDTSLPPTDQFYVQCTRGIDLTAGKTVRVVFALVAGSDETDFRDNAQLAQELYDNYFVGPEPPATPKVQARAADGKVYLSWSDTSEVSLDPMSGVTDFVGYKLYRSEDRGRSWGRRNYDNDNECLDIDYITLAEWSVFAPGDPIPHTFVDSNLYNGADYWYCLAAYDGGDSILGVAPLQSGFGIAGEAANVVGVTPTKEPAGFYEANTTVEHIYTGANEPSDGDVYPIVFNRSEVTGDEFSVVFVDSYDATRCFLVNETTGDSIAIDQVASDVDPNEIDVVEGLRVIVANPERMIGGAVQTGFSGTETTMEMGDYYGPGLPALGMPGAIFGDAVYRDSYELRFTTDSSVAGDLISGAPVSVPLEVWNLRRDERVMFTVYDFEQNGTWEPYDLVCVVDYPYDPSVDPFSEPYPFDYSWMFGFDPSTFNPSVGDVFTVYGAPLNGPDDQFTFKVDGVDALAAGSEMKNIKAVPNPYFVRNSWRAEQTDSETQLQFKGVPGECKLRIYTLAGDLVKTIDHRDGTGEISWNLLSDNRQQVASGMYLFQVESDYGEFLGRFAVVK